jgi:hypothetical protein
LKDRHDWIVDRCGKEIRYIIDYYYVEDEKVGLEKKENGFFDTKKNVKIDVRPAIFDSFENFKENFLNLFK